MKKLSNDYFIEQRIRHQRIFIYLCLLLSVCTVATFHCAAMLDEQTAKQTVMSSIDPAEVIYTIAQTQCFYSTDWCCEWAFELFENSDDPARDMHTLVRSQCFEPSDGCLEWAFGLVEEPKARSVLTYPLPHEGY